ncbi:MAG TPA: hypothetical protein VKG92_03975, partial [Flavobacteriales bacterium]|nr:hypothetical protein [Flavobacteriales bacterium]
ESQSNTIAGEITSLYKQIRGAQIREAVAKREWENHQKQIENAKAIEEFLVDERKGKLTNQAFYTWMKREVKGLYGQCYQFAFEVAKKAERALQHELGDPQLRMVKYDYFSGKEGLLAGEKLFLDIKRMELAYHELQQDEHPLTVSVSLRELDPVALIQLRTTGSCSFTLPEEFFDARRPGHYFRRIKTLAVSIPCVAGPHTAVNATVTLLRSSIRTTPNIDPEYGRTGPEDERFDDHGSRIRSIVTSNAQSDSGTEPNPPAERYLPFEGAGAISEWSIELPPMDVRQFDYDTISDVVLQLRISAREGGAPLRTAAAERITTLASEGAAVGAVGLFSIRQDFPAAWKALKAPGAPPQVTLPLTTYHFPFWAKDKITGGEVSKVRAWAAKLEANGSSKTTELTGVGQPNGSPVGDRVITLPDLPPVDTVKDLWVAVAWKTS